MKTILFIFGAFLLMAMIYFRVCTPRTNDNGYAGWMRYSSMMNWAQNEFGLMELDNKNHIEGGEIIIGNYFNMIDKNDATYHEFAPKGDTGETVGFIMLNSKIFAYVYDEDDYGIWNWTRRGVWFERNNLGKAEMRLKIADRLINNDITDGFFVDVTGNLKRPWKIPLDITFKENKKRGYSVLFSEGKRSKKPVWKLTGGFFGRACSGGHTPCHQISKMIIENIDSPIPEKCAVTRIRNPNGWGHHAILVKCEFERCPNFIERWIYSIKPETCIKDNISGVLDAWYGNCWNIENSRPYVNWLDAPW